MTRIVYTIGHSNVTSERLLALLEQHGITAVADVRSRPYSRFNPQFNREALAGALKGSRARIFFSRATNWERVLKIAPATRWAGAICADRTTPVFRRGIECLLAKMENFRVAILCAEKEPLSCHRSILIARYLHERSLSVRHILEDGSLEDHDALLLRLLALHGIQENHLFHTREELVAIAYEKQAEGIEYSASEVSA